MNAKSQTDDVVISGANNDAAMRRAGAVQVDEMTAVKGQHSTALGNGECQDGGIGDGEICLPRLLNCQNVMTKSLQLLGDRKGKILVAVQLRHEP